MLLRAAPDFHYLSQCAGRRACGAFLALLIAAGAPLGMRDVMSLRKFPRRKERAREKTWAIDTIASAIYADSATRRPDAFVTDILYTFFGHVTDSLGRQALFGHDLLTFLFSAMR